MAADGINSKFYTPADKPDEVNPMSSDVCSTTNDDDAEDVDSNANTSTRYRAQAPVDKPITADCIPHRRIEGAYHASRSKFDRSRSCSNSSGSPRVTARLYHSHGNTRTPSKNLTNRIVAELVTEIVIYPDKDSNFTRVVAAIFFSDDRILVAEYENGELRLQLLDLEGNTIDCVYTGEGLSDLAALNEDSFFALLNDFVHLYEIVDSKLVCKKKLFVTDLGHSGFSISKLENYETLTIACETCILQVNLNGDVVRRVKLPEHNLISACVYSDKFIFSDRHFYSVHCIDIEGNEVFKYQHEHLKFPRYVSADRHGFIYVVGELSNNIHRLKPDGTLDMIILSARHGLKNPRVAVLQEGRSDALLVCDDERRLRVYQLESLG